MQQDVVLSAQVHHYILIFNVKHGIMAMLSKQMKTAPPAATQEVLHTLSHSLKPKGLEPCCTDGFIVPDLRA